MYCVEMTNRKVIVVYKRQNYYNIKLCYLMSLDS